MEKEQTSYLVVTQKSTKSPFDYVKGNYLSSYSNINFFKRIFSLDKDFNFKDSNFKAIFLVDINGFHNMKQKKYFQKEILNEINLNDIFSPWEFNLNSNSDISELYNCVL